jgi:glycerol uptake facilitator-like aquaporin
MAMSRRLAAEFIGTFWLVPAGCGAAVISSGVPAAPPSAGADPPEPGAR